MVTRSRETKTKTEERERNPTPLQRQAINNNIVHAERAANAIKNDKDRLTLI